MDHAWTADRIAALPEAEFWTHFHEAARVQDHRAWRDYGEDFRRWHGLLPGGSPGPIPVERYHDHPGPVLDHLWETAQALYRGLLPPPLRTHPPPAEEARRFDIGRQHGGPLILSVDAATFDEEVLGVAGAVVVVFWAAWSAPDVHLLRWVQGRLDGWKGVKFVKLDVEEHPEAARRFDYYAMPTVFVFMDGQVVGWIPGQPAAVEGLGAALDKLAG